MARVLLTPEELAARKRARAKASFSNAAYKHYDAASLGFGNVEDWISAAEALAAAKGFLGSTKPRAPGPHADLVELGLMEMPADLAALKRAYRNALFISHPDHGGTDATARATIEAYTRLLDSF